MKPLENRDSTSAMTHLNLGASVADARIIRVDFSALVTDTIGLATVNGPITVGDPAFGSILFDASVPGRKHDPNADPDTDPNAPDSTTFYDNAITWFDLTIGSNVYSATGSIRILNDFLTDTPSTNILFVGDSNVIGPDEEDGSPVAQFSLPLFTTNPAAFFSDQSLPTAAELNLLFANLDPASTRNVGNFSFRGRHGEFVFFDFSRGISANTVTFRKPSSLTLMSMGTAGFAARSRCEKSKIARVKNGLL